MIYEKESQRIRAYTLAANEMRRLAIIATEKSVNEGSAVSHMHAHLTHARAEFCHRQLDDKHPRAEEHATWADAHAKAFLERQ